MMDNGPNSMSEGLVRIIDDKGLMGFAYMLGNIVIKPQYKFAFPFKGGKAKVTIKEKANQWVSTHIGKVRSGIL